MRWDILWRKSWFLIWTMQEKKILIVQQQVIAGAIRDELRKRGADGEITVASWFSMEKDLLEEGDVSLRDEEDYMELAEKADIT